MARRIVLPVVLLVAAGCKRDDAGVPGTIDMPTEVVDEEGDEEGGLAVSPRISRLTHTQWERTTTDLLRLSAPSGLSDGFIGDTLHEGFANNAEALQVTPELFRDYQLAAETLGSLVVSDPAVYARLVPQDPREEGIEFSMHSEVESDPTLGADNGDVSGKGWMLWADGTLGVDVDVPVTGTYVLSARLLSSDCGDGVYALAELGIDGSTLVEVQTTAAYQTYEVEAIVSQGTRRLEVSFTNDCYVEDVADRNLIVDWIALEGGGPMGTGTAGDAEAREWVNDFGSRAYRRPLTSDEQQSWFQVFSRGPDLVGSGDDFLDGVQLVVTAMLQTPSFLYRIESSTAVDADGRVPLDDYEMASKLSYALWGTMPDDDLFALASHGGLGTAAGVRAQAKAMLTDDRARDGVADFHSELLHLDNALNVSKDTDDFPMFVEGMPDWMREETERFVDDLVWEERGGLTELLSADYTIANGPIAALYGVAGPPDEQTWARVALDPTQRAGLLTQTLFLASHASSTTPSPIHRGVFVNRELLCVDLPDPPPEVAPLPTPVPGQTNREVVDAHTGVGTCGETCHAVFINPPGFALEHYDAIGQYRSTDNGKPVDAAAEYVFSNGPMPWIDGVDFAHLLAQHGDTHACYTRHWLEFLLARAHDPLDDPLIEPIASSSQSGASIQELIVEIVASEAFRYRMDEVSP